ncbi:MAG: hypothetical protein RL571_2252 [Pseudomonadota bacterium]|jgi:hypothetical protein
MSNYLEVGKIESAKRHLEVGILLFFERKDLVVVYTVAWTAYQVLSDLCKSSGFSRQIEDSQILEEMGVRKSLIAAFRKPRNFFQHAEKDANEKIKFFPDSSYLLLLLSIELYESLVSEVFLPGKIMRMWFFIKYPERAPLLVTQCIQKLPYKPNADDYDFFIDLLKA